MMRECVQSGMLLVLIGQEPSCRPSAATGVLAALLAERGYEGSLTAFEGKSGFWRTYSGENEIGR
jgi:hypothetical protein